ncbi:MAG: hypothetical protein BJ554DRAFT_5893, partial [Olpidium bornovanus]
AQAAPAHPAAPGVSLWCKEEARLVVCLDKILQGSIARTAMEQREGGRGANTSVTAVPSIPAEAAARFAELDRLALDIESLLAGLDQSVRNGETGPKDLQDKGGSARAMAKNLEMGIATAKEVTDSLQRTVRLMGEEINRSAYAAKVLGKRRGAWPASKISVGVLLLALQETQSEYASLSGVLRSSTTLLTRLEQRDWMDRLLILFGLLVFVLVALYIIKKRFWVSLEGVWELGTPICFCRPVVGAGEGV